jgi:spore germination protein D
MRTKWCLAAVAALSLLTSCGTGNSSAGGGAQNASNYKDTKSMVMDILKSDEGRRAVQSAAFGLEDVTGKTAATGIKTLSTGDAKQLQLAVKDVLTDQQNSAFLQNLMKDPKFAGDFAKALQKENKQLMKDLMKDPEYQKLQLDTMKNPEYQKIVLDTMRGTQYRQYVMSVIQESMQSPLFKADMINLLKKAIEEGTTAQAPQSTDKSAEGGAKDQGDKSASGGGNETMESSDKGDSGSSGGSEGDSGDSQEDTSQKKKKQNESGSG